MKLSITIRLDYILEMSRYTIEELIVLINEEKIDRIGIGELKSLANELVSLQLKRSTERPETTQNGGWRWKFWEDK